MANHCPLMIHNLFDENIIERVVLKPLINVEALFELYFFTFP
jgi:hypothetical protein